MYCPNCAAEASKDQKFCRSCGMELQAVAELVGAQTNITKPDQPKEMHFHGRRRAMVVWGMILTLGAAALGSSLKFLGREHIQIAGEFTPYLMVITLLIAFFGMGLMSYPFLRASMTPRGKSKSAAPRDPEPTVKLEPRLLSEERSSVTEQTTEFLEGSPLTTHARDTAPTAEQES